MKVKSKRACKNALKLVQILTAEHTTVKKASCEETDGILALKDFLDGKNEKE